MATLGYLALQGKLKKHDADLEAWEQPIRFVYFSLEADAWIANTLISAQSDHGNNRSPFEQVEAMLHEFIVRKVIAYGSRYHPLDPIGHYVWELKTPDVRLIGWFARRGVFVVVCGRLKCELKPAKLVSPCVNNVVWFRNQLDLDVPKWIVGASSNAVL